MARRPDSACRRRGRVSLVAGLVLGILLAVAPAQGFWTATSTGSDARAQAATLTAPTLTAGSATATTVPLSWNQPFTPTSYALGQTAGTLAGCSSAPATTVTGCTATGLTPNTSYTWTLTAKLQAWTTQATVSATTPKQGTTTTLSNLTPTTGSAGATFRATATVAGSAGFGTPAGSVVFSLYTSSSCTGSPSFSTSAQTLSGGTASGSLQPTAGTYFWQATYTPSDSVNLAGTSPCSSAITVNPVGTFAGIGTPTTVTGNTNNASVAYPTGTASGDLVLLVVVNNASQNITAPSGWTVIASPAIGGASMEMQAYWRKASTETSVVVPKIATNGTGATAWVVDYKNMANPALGGVSSGTNAAALGPVSPTTVTTTGANTTVISLMGINLANTLSLSTANGFTARTTTTSTGGSGRAFGVADRFVSAAGSVTPPSWAQGGLATQWAYITVAFTS